MQIQKSTGMFIVVLGVVLMSSALFAHCQIPCGIYNDTLRAFLSDFEKSYFEEHQH